MEFNISLIVIPDYFSPLEFTWYLLEIVQTCVCDFSSYKTVVIVVYWLNTVTNWVNNLIEWHIVVVKSLLLDSVSTTVTQTFYLQQKSYIIKNNNL